jgi:hypothetical protein
MDRLGTSKSAMRGRSTHWSNLRRWALSLHGRDRDTAYKFWNDDDEYIEGVLAATPRSGFLCGYW